MSFPRYPEYKDSGAEWLGEVPAHWGVAPFKRMISIQNGADHKSIEQDDGYPVIGSGGPFAYASEYMFDGESVLLGRKGTIDKPLYVTGRFWTVDTMYWTKIADDACGKYCYYTALTIPFDYYSTNTALPSMTKGALEAHLVALPPLSEQRRIAGFLDAEVEKIDGLVSEQEKLIALLKEKRQAVISHAVTKGLDPNVPMKDSGIEWLGEVPAHWKVTKVKHLISSIGQGWSPQCEGYPVESDHEWGVLKVGCVNGGRFSPAENKRLPDNEQPIPELGLAEGDVLVSRANTRELVGSAAVVDRAYPNLMLCDKLYRLRMLPGSVMPEFLSRYLGSDRVRGQIELMATGTSSSMLNIAQSTILELCIAIPGPDEQRQIVMGMDRLLREVDDLIEGSLAGIGLLKERRAAVISAAVTGKIDVRNIGILEVA